PGLARGCRRDLGASADFRGVRAAHRDGYPLRARGAERRPADSHRRRATAQRFHAMGERVRRADLLRYVLARLHRAGVSRGARRVRTARSPLRSAVAALGLTVAAFTGELADGYVDSVVASVAGSRIG